MPDLHDVLELVNLLEVELRDLHDVLNLVAQLDLLDVLDVVARCNELARECARAALRRVAGNESVSGCDAEIAPKALVSLWATSRTAALPQRQLGYG